MPASLDRMHHRFPLDIAAVSAYLAGCGLAMDVEKGAPRLSGGLSNLNYCVWVDGRPAVLRRPPEGDLPPGAHDMVREHRVLSRLSKAFPLAPDSFLLCEDRSVIGVPFQLLDYREGIVISGDTLPSCLDTADHARAISQELVSTLVQLHAVDADDIGLGELGRPAGFYERNVSGWARRAAAAEVEGKAAERVSQATAWLLDNVPAPSAPTLLHSDFKLDNCMLDAQLSVSAVLDWDMGTRGDPLMDLATLLSYWTEPGDPDCMHRLKQMPTAKPGFLSRQEVIETYAAASGRNVSDFQSWRVLALLKLGIVFIQLDRIRERRAEGDASHVDFVRLGTDILDFAAAEAASAR